MTFDIGFGHDTPVPIVSVRQSWADDWTDYPYIIVDSINYTIGGSFGKALMRYEYGTIKQADSGTFTSHGKLNLDRYYVRVSYTPTTTGASEQYWYGVIISTSDNPIGGEAGNQILVAITLDWLLTQKQVTTSWVADGNGRKQVNRPVTFNASEGAVATGGNKPIANRHPTHTDRLNTQPVYPFAESIQHAELWTAYNVITYLLFHYPPSDGTGPAWTIPSSVFLHLDWFTPVYSVDGRTVYDLINGLIDKHRGLGWYVNASESGCEIVACSYSGTPITPGTGTQQIPANSLVAVTIDDEIQAARVSTITDAQNYYSQVRVTGARRGSCFSISPSDGTLLADWTSNDESAYLAGDTTAVGTDLGERKTLNDIYRNSLALRHVYSRFKLPDNWDGTSYGWHVCPPVDSYTGQVGQGGEDLWQVGLRFRPRLPLRRFFDYSTSIDNPTDNTPPSGESEFIPSFCACWIGSHRVLTHELQSWSQNELRPECESSSTLKASDDSPTLSLVPTSAPHSHAYGHYPDGYPFSDVFPTFDWQSITATVFVEWDTVCEAVYPQTAYPPINDQQSILTIRAGERYRMDYVARNTILDVREGDVVRAEVDGWARNDHDVLRYIARMAWEWYSLPRRSLRLSVTHVASDLSIGDLIGTLDSEPVYSLVTGLAYDFGRGTTKIETQFANLDARQLLG